MGAELVRLSVILRPAAVLAVVALALAGCAAVLGVDALMKQGTDLYAQGKYDEALGKFWEVIKRDPQHWSAYVYIARAFIAKHSWADAITNGKKAFELAPDKAEVVPVLAEGLLGGGVDALQRGQFSEAAGHLLEYVRLKPTDAQGYLHLGRALLGSRSYGEALGALTEGMRQNPDGTVRQQLVQTLLEGGGQALTAGDGKAAVALLSQYVRLDPRNVGAYLSLGKAYWQDGDVGNALAAFRRVLELSPNEPEALRFLGGAR
jgi:tetratricopeptide (TPR) repeat protein